MKIKIREPLVITLLVGLPDNIPKKPDASIATLAGPPLYFPIRDSAIFIKNLPPPVSARIIPYTRKPIRRLPATRIGIPIRLSNPILCALAASLKVYIFPHNAPGIWSAKIGYKEKNKAIKNIIIPPVLLKDSNDKTIKIKLKIVGNKGASISQPLLRIFSEFIEKYIPIKNIDIAANISLIKILFLLLLLNGKIKNEMG